MLAVDAGIDAIKLKAQHLTGFGLELCDQLGLASSTPRNAECRGGHVAVHHPHAERMVAELAERLVLTDYREPDIVRIGCSPLTTRFTDVFDGLTRLSDLVQRL